MNIQLVRRIRQSGKSCGGAAILESVIVMIMLLLILFGFLQLFQISVAQIVSDYASFRAARSSAVGFKKYLSRREAIVKSIPASGRMIEPVNNQYFGSARSQFAFERTAIRRFMEGEQYLDYEYWHGDGAYHTDYHCPFYGQLRAADAAGCTCSTESSACPSASVSISPSEETVRARFQFSDYPLTLPFREAFTGEKSMDICSEVELTNFASTWLE